MKPFQAIVLALFLALALFGIFIFATFTASHSDQIGNVTIWGDLPQDTFDTLLSDARSVRSDFNGVVYKEVPADQLMPQLVAAIASGKGPDLVLFPASGFVKNGDKLQPIPYSAYPKRTFQDSFVDASEIFLTKDGVTGLPLTIDPMVLYWNRSLFANAGIASPPKFWDDVATLAPQLTVKAQNGTITTAAVALGGWTNVAYAKNILITLMNGLGTPVVGIDSSGNYATMLTRTTEGGVSPADSAVRFYTDFADPVKPTYSWNRSQANSRDAFLAGTLALYMAPASELLPIRAANPNLNFDVAAMPTARGGGSQVFADVRALAVPRGAANYVGAVAVAEELTNQAHESFLATELHMPSPRRDVELDASSDQYLSVFRQAALKGFVFPDPDPVSSDQIFARMIDDVTSGRSGSSEAIRNAEDSLQQLLKVQ